MNNVLKKIRKYLPFIPLLSIFYFSGLLAQDITPVIDRKQTILVLPYNGVEVDPSSLDAEVTDIFTETAVRLNRFFVIDRLNLQQMLDERGLYQPGLVDASAAMSLGKFAATDQVLVISVSSFLQHGVPPDVDDDDDEEYDDDNLTFWGSMIVTFVAGVFSDDKEIEDPYPYNIQSQLTVQVKRIDLLTGNIEDSFFISVSHTGGSHEESYASVINRFKQAAAAELKNMFLLSSEIVAIEGNEALLGLGADAGIKKDIMFEVFQPDRFKVIGDKEFRIPGRSVGLVRVSDVSSETNRSQIVRMWDQVNKGQHTVEYTGNIHGVQVSYSPPFPEDNFFLGVGYNGRPLSKFKYGFDLRYSQYRDSYNETDRGFGFGGYIGYRLFNKSALVLNGKIGFNIDLAFKTDDRDHSAYTSIFTLAPAFNIGLTLSRNVDLNLDLGYRLANNASDWIYNSGDNSADAVWDIASPKINIRGVFLEVGFNFLIF